MAVVLLKRTGINNAIQLHEFTIPDYVPLIAKYDYQNHHKLSAYIKDGLPCGRDTKNKDPDLPYMCFHLALICSTTFIFTLSCLWDDGTLIFNQISGRIDNLLTEFLSASFHICGEFTTKSG